MEVWKVILLSIIILLLVNKLTFNIRFDYVGLNNENITDFKDFKVVIYWWSFKKKCRMEKLL